MILATWVLLLTWGTGWALVRRLLPQVGWHRVELLGWRGAQLARWLPLTWPLVLHQLLFGGTR